MTPWLDNALASACALTLLLLAPSAAHADAERVALVVESSLPSSAVAGIERELAKQADVIVESLSVAAERSSLPRVTITVVNDPSGVIRVFYWDATGSADSLSVPNGGAQLELVASTLAAALLQRHLPQLNQRRVADEACESWETFLTFRRTLFPLHTLRAVHRRTYPITTADF